MKKQKITIELTNDELLNIVEMLEHYVEVTADEIEIDDDLLKAYSDITDKLIAIYNDNK